ncbi:MAG: hypothetical protein ACI4IS_02940 [Acutalibacteraceae bacterium]
MDEDSYNYLREWSEDYRKYVRDCPAVAPKFMIICKVENLGDRMFLYVTKTQYGYKFNLNLDKTLVAKGKIIRTPDGENDFQVSYRMSETVERECALESKKKQQEHSVKTEIEFFIEMYSNAFLMANAFLMYGNVIDEKNIIATGKNAGNDKIIVFRKYKDKLYAVPVGHHRSPEGVFEVRGHFRHYKNTGKVVWIDGYLKGTDKNEK